MLNLILLALYIAPILAVLFLEQKNPTEALLWVLVMCDFIANLATPRRMFQPLVAAGSKVIRIQPYLTHYRSHRKIVTIDHQIGYIGGMNIGKQYANLAQKKSPWRDTQIRLTGACAANLDAYFMTDFLCAVRRKEKFAGCIFLPFAPLM